MAQQPTSAAEQRERQDERQAKTQLVVVELSRRRTPDQVRRLREGRGKLMRDIDDVIDELVEAGTIKANAQPVAIVVRELAPPFPWPFEPPDYEVDTDDDDDD
jgi:hypothetical protein